MGQSGKKSASKVDAAVPSSLSAEEGKREAEDELEKEVSAKKQKRGEVAEKQKNEKQIRLDDSSSDYEQDKKPAKTGTLTCGKKCNPATSSSSSEYSDDDSDEDEAPKSKEAPPGGKNGPDATKKKVQSSQSSPDRSSESDSGRSSDEENGVMDVDEGDSSEESDEEAQKKKMKVLPSAVSNAQKPDSKTVEKDTSSESSDDDDDDDDDGDDSSDDSENPHMVKIPVKDSESLEDSEEEIKEKSSKIPQESVKDVEVVDAASIGKKAPKIPATMKEQNATSKTIYVRNLSYSVERADMENLFKECGEIVDVRLHTDNEGRFRGFGHVEFATAEAAQKALELDNTELLRRPIKVGIAKEKGEYTPNRSYLSNSFQKGGRVQSQTVFVKGFDRSLAEEKIKASLEEHFNSCGEITRISIPKYHDSGAAKGFAHLDFKDVDSLKKALQLHGTELGGNPLSVEKAKPRRDNQVIGGGRGSVGHQFGGRDREGHGFGGRGRNGGSWRR